MKRFVFAFAAAAVILTQPVGAVEISGVQLADKINVAGKSLVFNGGGLRQATIFKVKVYAGGLYLESPSHDPAAILKSESPKSIEMVFMRDVDAKDVTKAWDEGFDKNCETGCEALKPELDKFKAPMTDVKKGDRLALNFLPTGVELVLRGKKISTSDNKDLSKALPLLWIGKNPPNEALKNGMLGIKD
jgi:hypothetical protein